MLISLAVAGILIAISGPADAVSSLTFVTSGPVAESSAGYLRPPALLSRGASPTGQPSLTDGPVAVLGAEETPGPQATPDPTAAPQPGYFTYTIQPGDTVDSIAAAYGVDPGYIIWNNPEIGDPDTLLIGATMLIPATDGLVYHVTLGDTLGGIAATYGVDVNSIVSYAPNHLTSPDSVVEDQVLVIPGAQAPAPVFNEPVPAAVDDGSGGGGGGATYSSGFIWPYYGGISQYFGEPELGSYHKGLDIEGYTGDTVTSAAAGLVVLAAWADYGLGYHVIVDHGNGIQTIYAHLSDIWVAQGQYVGQGEAVGAMGSTGYSTGPHLHFQVNVYGTPTDPLAYLP